MSKMDSATAVVKILEDNEHCLSDSFGAYSDPSIPDYKYTSGNDYGLKMYRIAGEIVDAIIEWVYCSYEQPSETGKYVAIYPDGTVYTSKFVMVDGEAFGYWNNRVVCDGMPKEPYAWSRKIMLPELKQ